ncbi:MAG: PA2169 family four-helix-bundle protein [Chthoniobacter sp.]
MNCSRRRTASVDSNPENASSLSGTLHRGWINLKTAIGGRDQHAILAECERGEDIAVAEYKKTLDQELPKDIREIVEHQYAAIVAAHDRVKALRDA